MVKTHNRIIAGVLSVLFTGQIALFGDGTSKGILHPDTIAYAAESIKEKKTEKELADEFEKAVSELGQVDYFGDTDVVTGSRLLKSARGRSANSDPMDDVSSSLTVSGIVSPETGRNSLIRLFIMVNRIMFLSKVDILTFIM